MYVTTARTLGLLPAPQSQSMTCLLACAAEAKKAKASGDGDDSDTPVRAVPCGRCLVAPCGTRRLAGRVVPVPLFAHCCNDQVSKPARKRRKLGGDSDDEVCARVRLALCALLRCAPSTLVFAGRRSEQPAERSAPGLSALLFAALSCAVVPAATATPAKSPAKPTPKGAPSCCLSLALG